MALNVNMRLNIEIELKNPKLPGMMKLPYATGIGSMNSLGFGMWEERKK